VFVAETAEEEEVASMKDEDEDEEEPAKEVEAEEVEVTAAVEEVAAEEPVVEKKVCRGETLFLFSSPCRCIHISNAELSICT